MEFGGIILALSALLWLAYLLPTWLRRRQYLATERNAVRLQQTLRVLAETAEVPDEVRAETSARSVAEQQRALRKVAAEAEAAARARDAAAARALPKVTAKAAASPTAAVRLRRGRLTATIILALSLVGVFTGLSSLAAGGGWTLLIAGSLGGMLAILGLQRMSQVAQARRVATAPQHTRVRTSFTDFAEYEVPVVVAQEEAVPWTPVAIPKPLYLSRTAAPTPSAEADASAARAMAAERELRDAAATADRVLRDAHTEPEVLSLNTPAPAEAERTADAPPAAAPAPQSRFARMGIVEVAEPGMADLDAVLRRRRAG